MEDPEISPRLTSALKLVTVGPVETAVGLLLGQDPQHDVRTAAIIYAQLLPEVNQVGYQITEKLSVGAEKGLCFWLISLSRAINLTVNQLRFFSSLSTFSLSLVIFQIPHLSKGSSGRKQKCTQFPTPFSGTVFDALSHGVIHFVRSVSFKNLEMEVF